ncbi:MAG TPA: DUF3592 domain-containing protein [Streptosporangiaceae bacterium]
MAKKRLAGKRHWPAAWRPARLSWTIQSKGNPLRRPVDRKEARLIAGLLVIFLLAGPLVAVLGAHLSYAASLRDMHAQRSWREVTATLVENATDSSATGGAWAPVAAARWTAPDGRVRHGILAVDSSARAGQHIKIWVDGTGQPTLSPMPKIGAVLSAVTVGLSVPAFLALLLILVGWLVRLALNRRRLADWETEWNTVEPRWRSPR